MGSLFRLLLMLSAWFGLASVAAAAPHTVILVSIDGFRADYRSHGKTPVIAALAAQGVQGPMRPSFPSPRSRRAAPCRRSTTSTCSR